MTARGGKAKTDRWHYLLQQVVDGRATPAEKAEFEVLRIRRLREALAS